VESLESGGLAPSAAGWDHRPGGRGLRPGLDVADEPISNEDASTSGDSRKAATQARILRAAMGLFMRGGYERTTVAAIAEEAGVSRAAIFWHFNDKATLFAAATRQLLVPFLQELERDLAHLDPRERVLELFTVYEEFVEKNRETIETFMRWVLESPSLRASLHEELFSLHDNFARDLREALGRALGDEQEAARLAAALVALLDGNLLLSLLDSDPRARRLRREGLRSITSLLLDADER
jgi:TetR/AcrR family acrAB operon transcriptional repressor